MDNRFQVDSDCNGDAWPNNFSRYHDVIKRAWEIIRKSPSLSPRISLLRERIDTRAQHARAAIQPKVSNFMAEI